MSSKTRTHTHTHIITFVKATNYFFVDQLTPTTSGRSSRRSAYNADSERTTSVRDFVLDLTATADSTARSVSVVASSAGSSHDSAITPSVLAHSTSAAPLVISSMFSLIKARKSSADLTSSRLLLVSVKFAVTLNRTFFVLPNAKLIRQKKKKLQKKLF